MKLLNSLLVHVRYVMDHMIQPFVPAAKRKHNAMSVERSVKIHEHFTSIAISGENALIRLNVKIAGKYTILPIVHGV